MKVYVINLEVAGERLAFMTKQLGEAGVAFERFPAVDGRALSEEELRRVSAPLLQRLFMGRKLLKGEIGCALSHKRIWEKIVEEGEELACILEDDVTVLPGLAKQLAFIEEKLDKRENAVCVLWAGERGGETRLCPYEEPYYTWGYVVTRRAAEFLLASLTPIAVPCDNWNTWRTLGLKTLACLPRSVEHLNQAAFGSMIDGVRLPGKCSRRFWRLLGIPVRILWLWGKRRKMRKRGGAFGEARRVK